MIFCDCKITRKIDKIGHFAENLSKNRVKWRCVLHVPLPYYNIIKVRAHAREFYFMQNPTPMRVAWVFR